MIEDSWYPFVRLPLDPSVTTIVGANESGKSHLLDSIEKAITGKGIESRDFCRYSRFFSVREGQRRRPDFGLELEIASQEDIAHAGQLGIEQPSLGTRFHLFRLNGGEPVIYGPSRPDSPISVSSEASLSASLPVVFRLDARIPLPTSIPLYELTADARRPPGSRRARWDVLETPPPGQEAQVDYGRLGMWTDSATGRRVTAWAFVMVLSNSRHMFVRPVLKMDQQTWTAAHVEAFEFFGGVPARVIPDNLATGVARADLYDPKLNRSYAELAEHYGVLIDPARARKPRDKPRVERPMPYVRDSFWRGREFTSLTQMQAAAVVWCREVAGQRACRPLDGAAPAVVFAAVEAQALKPLPRKPFELAIWSTGTLGPDIHVKVGKALYSAPWRLIGAKLDARATWNTVQLFHKGQLVATHVRADKGKRTDMAHYPPEKIAFAMKTPVWCRRRSREIGPSCAAVIGELLEVNALFRLRSAQGVLGLADRHGAARLEAACAKAIAAGDPSYRTIKGILAAGLETEPAPASAGDGGASAHLHGQAALFDVDNVYPLVRREDGAA